MERRLLIWTDASPRQWDRAKYTFRGVSPAGTAGGIISGEIQEANQTSATLEAAITGLGEYSGKQKQKVCLVCSCPTVIGAINQRFIDKWRQNGFLTTKKKPVEHADLWKKMYSMAEEKQIELTSRAPDPSETELFYEMGASYFIPHASFEEYGEIPRKDGIGC